jgi:CheY-like chemotaxis protein
MVVVESEFEVVGATGAMLAYALACQQVPDVIVVDLLVSDGDGLLLCQWLRRNPVTAGIPVVVITGDDAAYTRAQAVRSELTGILMKPCSADRLLAALREAVTRVG